MLARFVMKIIVCDQNFSGKKSTNQPTRSTSFFFLKKLVPNEYFMNFTTKNDKSNTVYSTFYAESKSEVKNQLFCMQESVMNAERFFPLTSRFTAGRRI
jgi:hypothetical protein